MGEIRIRGSITSIVFQSDDQLYTVAKLYNEVEKELTITGELFGISVGDKIEITGNMVNHERYGNQFRVKTYEIIKPNTKDEIFSFLSSGVIQGIGEKNAKRIVDLFGEKTLEVIENEPEKLLMTEGIGKKTLKKIIKSYQENMGLKNIIIKLSKYNISTKLCAKIYSKYREYSLEVLEKNPYRLCSDIRGIGFKKADEIAIKMGIDLNIKERKIQAILFILSEGTLSGHTFLEFEEVSRRMKELINHEDIYETEAILLEMFEKKQVFIEGTEFEKSRIYLYKYAMAETKVAAKLIKLATSPNNIKDLDKAKSIIEKEIKYSSMEFSQQQIESCYDAIENNVLIITGGPGTGKTTTLSFLINVFEKLEKSVNLCAPTGKAAKRMSQTTGRDASTIHRLLDMSFESDEEIEVFLKNEEEPLKADVIIVDESSMIDILLMKSLLDAIKDGAHLILVGDMNQLPSVGAGNVLKDIIDSDTIPCVKLTKIFRQAQKSNIVVNAHRINNGQMPLPNDRDKDFFTMIRNKKDDVENLIAELVNTRLPNYYKLSPNDIQIITPMKKSQIGTVSLNILLQSVLNPKSPTKNEIKYGQKIFRQNDRVIHIKNNYNKEWISDDDKGTGVFNGDTGNITGVDKKTKSVLVLFDDGKKVSYEFDELSELEHSFALTVHKSQGSEYPCVILPLFSVAPMLTTRKILYTAITRAKNLLILISDKYTIKKMVDNVFEEKRNSSLRERLEMFKKYDMIEK